MKKELIQLLKGKNAYIQTHDFPDPDALATAFALQEYLKSVSYTHLTLPTN